MVNILERLWNKYKNGETVLQRETSMLWVGRTGTDPKSTLTLKGREDSKKFARSKYFCHDCLNFGHFRYILFISKYPIFGISDGNGSSKLVLSLRMRCVDDVY